MPSDWSTFDPSTVSTHPSSSQLSPRTSATATASGVEHANASILQVLSFFDGCGVLVCQASFEAPSTSPEKRSPRGCYESRTGLVDPEEASAASLRNLYEL